MGRRKKILTLEEQKEKELKELEKKNGLKKEEENLKIRFKKMLNQLKILKKH